MMFWRTFTVALGLMGAVLVAPPGAHAQVVDDDRPDSLPIQDRADARLQAGTSNAGWDRFSVDGNFDRGRPIPSEHASVAVDLDTGRLVRYDLDTNDLISGERVGGPDVDIVVSTGGDWIYTVEFERSGFGDNGRLKFRRYRSSDLGFDSSFELEPSEDEGLFLRDPVVLADPTDDDRLVFLTEGRIGIIDNNGVVLPETQQANNYGSSTQFGVTGNGFAVVLDPGGAFVYTVGVDGVVASQEVIDDERGFLQVFRSGFKLDETYFAVPGVVPQEVSDFELARPDPDLPFRYGSAIFDENTGEVLPPGRPCPAGPGLVGDGWIVGPELNFRNLLDSCGAYGEFTAVQPDRVFDTRSGNGEPGEGDPLTAGAVRRIEIHGDGGVPETGLESVVLNVTAVRQRGVGPGANYLTVWPAGFDQPTVANVNLRDGETVGNMVTVSTAAGGFVDVYSNAGTVDLTVDVVGYFASAIAPGGARYEPVDTTRLLDTRPSGKRVEQGGSLTIDAYGAFRDRGAADEFGPVLGRSDVIGAVVNVTAVQPSTKGFYRIFPTGTSRPNASAMNFPAGTNTNRLVTVKLGDGSFDLFNDLGSSHVTVDLVGIYTTQRSTDSRGSDEQSGRFVGLVPYRDLDTRIDSPFEGDGRVDEQSVLIQPGYVHGLSLVTNVTAIRPTRLGYLSAGPWNDDRTSFSRLAGTSSLNFSQGSIIGNQAVIEVDARTGEIAIFNAIGRTHVTMDVFGYYTGTNAEARSADGGGT